MKFLVQDIIAELEARPELALRLEQALTTAKQREESRRWAEKMRPEPRQED